MMARTSTAVTISQQVKQVYIYKLDHDTGMNPNPFGNFCTLAYCMHGMREKIVKHIAVQRSTNPTLSITNMGIWIIGIAGKKLDFNGSNRYGRIVYAMQVTEALTFEEYWTDPRFTDKKPNYTPEEEVLFNKGHEGNYRFFKNNSNRRIVGDNIEGHYDDGSRHVLVSDRFEYYGSDSENQMKLLDYLYLSENDTMRGDRKYPSSSGKPIPAAINEYIEKTFKARKCLARPVFSNPNFEM